MATAFNPCGVAVLPSYLGYLATRFGVRRPVRHALLASATLTLVSTVVFGTFGMAVRLVGQGLFQLAPPLALAVAGLLLAAGVATLLGYRPYVALPQPELSGRSYAMALVGYGVSFALTSLGCALPVFLAVALQATSLGTPAAVFMFLTFGVAMGIALLPISLAGVLLAGKLGRVGASLRGRVERLSGLIMVFSATYLLWYWTIGPEHLL